MNINIEFIISVFLGVILYQFVSWGINKLLKRSLKKTKGNKFDDFMAIKRHIESINHTDQIPMYMKVINRFNRKYKDHQLRINLNNILKDSKYYFIRSVPSKRIINN